MAATPARGNRARVRAGLSAVGPERRRRDAPELQSARCAACNCVTAAPPLPFLAVIRPHRPRRLSSRRLSWLRLLLSAWLLLGLALQPVLAAACDIGDAGNALAGERDQAAQSATSMPDQPGAANSADDCCANPACGDCCLTATASLPAQALALRPMPRATPAAHPDDAFAPRQTPVENPPPIQG